MIKKAILLGASAFALSIAGCDDGADPGDDPTEPSLRVLGTTDCGKIFLPTVLPDELRNEQFRTMAITVSGRDPTTASGQIAANTEVQLSQTAEGGEGAVAFLSAYATGRASNLDQLMALEQAGASTPLTFVTGTAADRIICVTPGQVRISARVADYNGVAVSTATPQTFVVVCQTPAQYEVSCGEPVVPDMGLPDMDLPDGDVPDGGGGDMSDVDMGDDRPGLWSISFVPPEDPSELIIGIRNSGLGRTDNVALQFQVGELGSPLPDIPVKFVLSSITQPGVTVSGSGNGAANVWEDAEEGESIVLTGAAGVSSVRVIAGGTPGLAVLRAVALRLPEEPAARAQLFTDADCTDDGRDGYNCMFEAYCRRTLREQDGAERETLCQADRSSQVVIRAGIPSGRGMQLDCDEDVLPAFTRREGDRWLVSNEPGTDCELQVADRVNGRVDEGTQIFFLTEAGTVNQFGRLDEDGRAITHHRVGLPPPRDVRPDDYELDAGYYRDGFNPRDGLVRLVAVTKGEEDFNDTNGDKIFSPGTDILEPGQDLPEPYIDVNDNGEWDDGEEFRDANNDGVWTDSNGEWDSNTEIWVSTTVLWVGELFSCYGSEGQWDNNPDCGCLLPDGERAQYECEDHVGQQQRDFRTVTVACTNDLCAVPGRGDACEGSAFELLPGARFGVETRFWDINGNCLNGRGEGSVAFNAPAGIEITSGGNGDLLRRDCFSAFERPIGQVLRTNVLDTGMGGQPLATLAASVNYRTIDGDQLTHTTNVSLCRVAPVMPPPAP